MPIYGSGSLNENLLTNSGFEVWSNYTDIDNIGGNKITSWSNGDATGAVPFSTFGTSGADWGTTAWSSYPSYARSNALSLTRGKIYILKVDDWTQTSGSSGIELSFGNGQVPGSATIHLGTGGVPASWSLVTGTSSTASPIFMFEATAAMESDCKIWVKGQNSGYAGWSSITWRLYEMTPYKGSGYDACDGWSKDSSQNVFREPKGSNTQSGSQYSMKWSCSAGDQRIWWPGLLLDGRSDPSRWQRFAGKDMAFGAWVKSDTASRVRVEIQDGGTIATSSLNSGTGWEWLECTKTMGATPTTFQAGFHSANGSATIYLSQPMLVFGTSIGAGNYQRPKDEIVFFQKSFNLTGFDGTDGMPTSPTEINIHSKSRGRIPRGVKAIYASLTGSSASTAQMFRLTNDSSESNQGLQLGSPVANVATTNDGWAVCDAYGNVWHKGGTVFNAMNITCKGVMLR